MCPYQTSSSPNRNVDGYLWQSMWVDTGTKWRAGKVWETEGRVNLVVICGYAIVRLEGNICGKETIRKPGTTVSVRKFNSYCFFTSPTSIPLAGVS